jgi:S1-C subfamily serine protease
LGVGALAQDLTAGTGFFVDDSGLVFSNKHVVAAVCTKGIGSLQITGLNHQEIAYDLELLSIDPIEDIAILRVVNAPEEEVFQPVELANSENLQLGQDVIAIGNVLGELQNTVTRGIISGLNRSFQTSLVDQCTNTEFEADSLIQTDAAINRGNSGGPLFNASGQLIGMNTLGTTDAENIGLSIPSSTIKNVVDTFRENEKIIRARN